MSRIQEILRSGKAPGMNFKAPDETSADCAIPRALKQLEQTHSAQKIAKDAGFSVKQLKQTWKI